MYQTTVCMRREHALREMNNLHETLKATTERLGDPKEVKQQLSLARRALTAKNRKLKALSAETTARDGEVKERDRHLETLRQDLLEKKQIILKEKRDKHKLKLELAAIKTELKIDDRPFTCPPVGQGFQTAGAGFRIPNFD